MNALNTSTAALSCGFRSRLRLTPARRRPRLGLTRKDIDMPRRSKSYSKAIIDRDGKWYGLLRINV
jgi:hypothetical protein